MADSPGGQHTRPQAAHEARAGVSPDDFAPTQIEDRWPEAADGRCSEQAARFADSQAGPLSIV